MIMASNMEDGVKRLLLASVAAVALLGGSANAADLARPAPIYAPAPVLVPLFTWTGCYVGGNVGGIWAHNDWNDTIVGDFGTNTGSGAIGGVQGGCNYQFGAWVWGIQGDYDWTNANNSRAKAPLAETDCVAGHVRLELANVILKKPLKMLGEFSLDYGTFWDQRLFALELRRRGYAARAYCDDLQQAFPCGRWLRRATSLRRHN